MPWQPWRLCSAHAGQTGGAYGAVGVSVGLVMRATCLVAEGGGAGADALLAQRVVREVEMPQARLAQRGGDDAQRGQRLVLCTSTARAAAVAQPVPTFSAARTQAWRMHGGCAPACTCRTGRVLRGLLIHLPVGTHRGRGGTMSYTKSVMAAEPSNDRLHDMCMSRAQRAGRPDPSYLGDRR